MYASVILELSIEKALDYLIPEPLLGMVHKGVAVEVPLRGHIQRGIVIDVKEVSAAAKVLPIHRVVTDIVLTADLLELALWMAKYYMTPLGRVLKTMLPAGVRKNTQAKQQYYIMRKVSREVLRKEVVTLRDSAPQQAAVLDVMLRVRKGILHTELLEKAEVLPSSVKGCIDKGLLSFDIVRSDRSPLQGQEYFMSKPKILRDEQQQSLDRINNSLERGGFHTHLIFGVTGSGKTEIYIQAITKALQLGKNVIMLVPEISLTEQTIERFRCRFHESLTVLHHRLSDGERKEAWEVIREGKSRIVIGARSAIFSPMPALGLIIVDEEHEHSYKHTDGSPCYQARDVAIMRAKLTHATALLGSATPAIESYHNARLDKYTLSALKERSAAKLPCVHIVDMKREFEKAKGYTIFSDSLLTKIDARRKVGEQSILFLNRRGFHTELSCASCGQVLMCEHCSAKLTFHKAAGVASCHLCSKAISPPTMCPFCRAVASIKYQGMGTEKVQSVLSAIFPGIETLRIDADTTKHKGSLEMQLREFRSGKADVLIGTQMIAKGLHFPEVTLVGVLNADAHFYIPDFRATEQLFQLITQVAGRAGRGASPGEVIIQTATPEHPVIRQAAAQDYEAFFTSEIETRKTFGFPPFCRIVKILFTGKVERFVGEAAHRYAQALARLLPPQYICHPVVPAGHSKIKDTFRYVCIVRGASQQPIRTAIAACDAKDLLPASVQRFVDVDPVSIT